MKRVIVVGIIFTIAMPAIATNETNSFHLNENGRVLYVGGSGPNNYTKIQDAIDDASDGDTIFVYCGIYHESIFVNKSIDIVGEYRYKTIIMADERDAINVTICNVNITRFTIVGEGIKWPCAGIKLFKTKGISISDCDIYFSPIGVYVYASNMNRVENCDIGKNSCGIMLNLSEENSFVDCEIHHSLEEGCYLSASNRNILSGCNIYENDIGVIIAGRKNILSQCNITDNKIGINIIGYSNEVKKCNICRSLFGIELLVAFKNIITNNNFYENELNAFFSNTAFNIWLHNYWQGWVLPIPKPIFGFLVWSFREIAIPWLNFDWMPRMMPYRGGR